MIMYHGTSDAAAQSILASGFNQSSSGMLGRGVYVSADVNKAKGYGNSILKLAGEAGKDKEDYISRVIPCEHLGTAMDTIQPRVPANCGMGLFGPYRDMRL